MNRKYLTEAALNVNVKDAIILSVNEIYSLTDDDLIKYNIYCIISTEKTTISKFDKIDNSLVNISITSGNIEGQVKLDLEKELNGFTGFERIHFNENEFAVGYSEPPSNLKVNRLDIPFVV